LQRQIIKKYNIKHQANTRHETTPKSHDRRDGPKESRHSRSVSRHHHSLGHSTRRENDFFRIRENPKCIPCYTLEEEA